MRQLPHAQVIDDQKRHGREIGEIRLAGAVERGVGELLEQRVGFAIDDAITLLDDRAADSLGQMTFPCPWWPEKERVVALRDEAAGRQLVDQRPVHFLVEIEIEGVERAIGIAKARQFIATLEQAVLSPQEFVGDEHRHEIDGRDLFRLRLAQSGFQDGRHAGQAELAERAVELDEIHRGSPVVRSMRSR